MLEESLLEPSLPEPSMISAKILRVSREGSNLDLSALGDENRGWQLETVGSGWEALERMQSPHRLDLILFDLGVDDSDGLLTLRWMRRVRPDIPLLVLGSADDPRQKLEAIRLGAQDFLVHPWQPRQLDISIRRALSDNSEEFPESEILAGEIEHIGDDMFFVAASPTMRKLRAQAELLAQVNSPVFILGENGSGKDLAACLINKLSVRSGFPFLKLNCATLPGDVLESELFGGVSGNGRRKPGKFELCQRGTLFLDEITEMPLSLQAKLMSVLRDGYFVGPSDKRVPLDVRILAASQLNIEQAIADGRLREDLYYRLSAFTVHVPALRQRKEEIPLLLGHFMNRLARRYNLPTRIFSAAALEACQRHSWPGNLRELEKFVKRYLVMGDDESGTQGFDPDGDVAFWNAYDSAENGAAAFEGGSQPHISGLKSLVQSVKGEAERNAIASALDQARWNRKAAARLLKVSYRTLLYKIEQYHMTPPATHLPGYGGGNSGFYRERNIHKG